MESVIEKSRIQFGEARTFCFPMLDFNGIPPATLSSGGVSNLTGEYPNGETLVLGNEGYWKIWGISATMCNSTGGGGLADAANISIQIYDVGTGKEFFTIDTQGNQNGTNAVQAAPIEAVAGKWGNPKLFRWPKLFSPGTQLKLKAAHGGASTPTQRSPLYVVIHAQLIKDPAPSLANAQEKMSFKGEPTAFAQQFVLGGAGLAFNAETSLESPLNVKNDLLITGVCVRNSNLLPTAFINSIDPRRQEVELLVNINGTVKNNPFVQPQPCPVALIASQWGARSFPILSYYKVTSPGNLKTKITNRSQSTITTDFTFTYTGLMLV